ncbi:pyridoxal-phosphate dependent enzyme [Sediminispirochaeta smaragdinae]|jgi:cysteine synthase|uniref:Pyridoxal-5'-phosphate-dependent protein beta subunit n=1 Tax=Sediminispirochaeta smaragdinae (strain DSM 11293 / JCM 15392 / SEBR 4228) TaxID=573413 RepID=E1R8C6_SEDSS|nr:pyridoxal-phosphate dependent enzyme [Sediminispirochaeta smaragdinae]ADK79270.1 Pyridoxal-5'-phosphate-dependent protein beta subunit [Sediminispirochaeta smaragdinae DSM 11293]
MIDLTTNEEQIQKNAIRCKEQGILFPTFAEMREPETISEDIKKKLKDVGLWDVNSLNLYRVNWQNEPKKFGGGFGDVNYMELPSSLTGTRARILALVGKWFPTGAHKVGASYSCLAPRLVTGQFNPMKEKAVWPSTGNYCRGGAYISRLLACDSIAILPEEMSQERFDWLKNIAGETIATPGCESNVKEIFDKCRELTESRGDTIEIFNQFDQFPNHLWHYEVTGHSMEKVLKKAMGEDSRFAGTCLSSGSSGTLGSGEYLKTLYPKAKLSVAEALQCPTLYNNGFGGHRIEGIGDKHVPWIHNLKNTDMVIAIDDEQTIRLLRLFNEPVGREYLKENGVPAELLDQLDLLGISSIGNLIGTIKMAKYYELTEEDVLMTIFTDSFEMYESRLKELEEARGAYTREDAIRDYELINQVTFDHTMELSYQEQKRIHNLKYYTWVEQQDKTYDEINAQWYDHDYWTNLYKVTPKLDELIIDFNRRIKAL